MNSELLRQIPAIDRWLGSPVGMRLCAEFSRDSVTEALRRELASLRQAVHDGLTELPDFAGADFETSLRHGLQAMARTSLSPLINATGIIVHTNLGRAPLCQSAIDAVASVAGTYTNLEFDLNTGKRGSRNQHAARLLRDIAGAEDALVVNNCAAALVLVLAKFSRGRRTVISRGELIEIGGSFRMPDVIAESGAVMAEVGTTNRTSLEDYAKAIDGETRVLLASHPSNYRVVGFSARPALGEIAALARSKSCISVLDLGSGCLVDLTRAGFVDEPNVQQCLRSGIDLVTFSGDKLLGGPQAGIIVGRHALIEQLRGSPLARAMRIDKLSLTALVATLREYVPPNDPFMTIPVLRMLTENLAALEARTHELAAQLERLAGITVDVVDTSAFAGGGTLPAQPVASKALRIRPRRGKAEAFAEALRLGTPAVVGRIKDEALYLDLRTVAPTQLTALIDRIAAVSGTAR